MDPITLMGIGMGLNALTNIGSSIANNTSAWDIAEKSRKLEEKKIEENKKMQDAIEAEQNQNLSNLNYGIEQTFNKKKKLNDFYSLGGLEAARIYGGNNNGLV